MQAAELAKGDGGGAAWAERAGGARRAIERAPRRRAARGLRQGDGGDGRGRDVARRGGARVAAPVVQVDDDAGTGCVRACGAAMKPDAKFCGACGQRRSRGDAGHAVTRVRTVQVVLGLGFGDEGKGTIVDWLARRRAADRRRS